MNHSRAIFFETWIFYFHVIALHRIHLISRMIFYMIQFFSRDSFTGFVCHGIVLHKIHLFMFSCDSFTWLICIHMGFCHMIHLLSFADCLNHLIHMWFSVHDSLIFWSPFTQFIRFLIAFSYINDSLKFTCDFNMYDSFIFTCVLLYTLFI